MLNRSDKILKYVSKNELTIEIGPYFAPLMPKKHGNNVLHMDVYDAETLRKTAEKDPNIQNSQIDKIQSVDIVSDACEIENAVSSRGLRGHVKHIVSSHNFEHLPNPILFLQGCEAVLAPGGIVSMAIPDCRACFDFFRMPTRLSDWLEAYHQGRRTPKAATIFDCESLFAYHVRGTKTYPSCVLGIHDPEDFKPANNLKQKYEEFLKRLKNEDSYTSTHCSVLFPESFELLLWELRFLNLVELEILEITKTVGNEFVVHLIKEPKESTDEEYFYVRRNELLLSVSRNIGLFPYFRFDVMIENVVCTAQEWSISNGNEGVGIYGAGDIGKKIMKHAKSHGLKIDWVIDSDPSLEKTSFFGEPVMSLSDAQEQGCRSIIVGSLSSFDGINNAIKDLYGPHLPRIFALKAADSSD